VENSPEAPQKTRNGTGIWSSTITPRYHGKEMKSEYGTDVCTPMFITALFKQTRWWNQPRCPLTDEQRKCDTHTVEYYLVTKNNEILSFAATWMQLEYVCEVKEVRYRKTDRHHIISFTCGSSADLQVQSMWSLWLPELGGCEDKGDWQCVINRSRVQFNIRNNFQCCIPQ
jgi:hypothetical protein